MNSLMKAQEIYLSSVSEFQSICQLYKSILDKNLGRRFCTGEHCKTVFMVEFMFGASQWGASPKKFYTKEDAEKEGEALKLRYPSFVSEWTP